MHIDRGGLRIGLDHPKGDFSFLSHAHSDHTSGIRKQKNIIASDETLALAGIGQERFSHPMARMVDAGHILGSRQLVLEGDGEKLVYSGDISIKPNVFGMKAGIERCDHLILEATYGDPAYRFPSHERVHEDIARWVEGNESCNLVIGAYSLGKTQEMIRILNESGISPIVTEEAERFNEVYERYGLKLDRVVVGSEEAEEVMSGRFVALVPMGKAKRYFAHRLSEAFNRKTLCAAVTGWALNFRFDTDAAFPLSDHADFDDLVRYVEESGAKKVEFFCGNGSRVLEAAKAENGAIKNS